MNKFPVYKLLQRTTLVLTVLLMAGPAQQPALAMPKLEDEIPSLTLTKVADSETISPGQTITFTITIINEGNEKAENISLEDDYNQDILPTIAEIQSSIINNTLPSDSDAEVDETDGDIFPAQNDGEKITWDIGTIAQGEEIQLSYQATATDVFKDDNDIMVNTATIFVNDSPIKQAVVELTLQIPVLTISRDLVKLDGEGEILLGDKVRMSIRFTNNGTANAETINIIETFDESIVQTVDNTGDGQQEGATIRWSLDSLETGASSEVSYEMTLKRFPIPGFEGEPGLEPGIIEIHNEVTISAMGIEPVSKSFSHTIRTPIITIEGDYVDLNSGQIEPGDTLLFTITINNDGEVAANDITIQEDFDDSASSGIDDISDGGRENAGMISWTQDTLEPGAEKPFTYELILIGKIDKPFEVKNTAFAFINEIELDSAERTLIIEPVNVEAPRLFTDDVLLAILMGALVIIFAIQIAFISNKLIEKELWKDWYLRNLTDLTAAIFILVVVVLLSANNTLPVEGTIGIISGIAGYMLGRSGK
jgi:uncharacterized repeat protein (TIGR01451 family)